MLSSLLLSVESLYLWRRPLLESEYMLCIEKDPAKNPKRCSDLCTPSKTCKRASTSNQITVVTVKSSECVLESCFLFKTKARVKPIMSSGHPAICWRWEVQSSKAKVSYSGPCGISTMAESLHNRYKYWLNDRFDCGGERSQQPHALLYFRSLKGVSVYLQKPTAMFTFWLLGKKIQ